MAQTAGSRAALDDARISSDMKALIRRRFDAVDTMDLNVFLAQHTENSRLLFGGRPPAVGKAQAAEQVQTFWSAIAGVRHNLTRVSAVGRLCFVESSIDYERLDGRTVAVACCDVFAVKDGLIAETRAYLDQSAVFAEVPTPTQEEAIP